MSWNRQRGKKVTEKKYLIFNRLSLYLKITKIPLSHAVQTVMSPLVPFEEKALTVGISFSISFCSFFLILLFRFIQNNLTFDPRDRTATFL